MIGTRMVILAYCVLRYIMGDMQNIPLVLLLMLAYISSAAVSYIFKSAVIRRPFKAVSIAVLFAGAAAADPTFILPVAVDIIELITAFSSNKKFLFAFIAIPAIFAGRDTILEYMVLSVLGFLIYLLADIHFESLLELKRANERLRIRNEELIVRLNADSEYETQLRYLSQIEERNSLAQKIHDRVGHTLAGSIIQLEAAGLIMKQDVEKAGGMIRNVTENLKSGMESIRSTLRNIKPAPEQLGINRLKLLLEEFSRNNPIRTSLSYNGSLDVITYTQWKIIIDNTKEALTNALLYSFAANVDVRLDVLNKIVKAEIKDNGKGAFSIVKGMGLKGMEERTENAGGRLIVDGSNGFSVIMLLPAINSLRTGRQTENELPLTRETE